MWGIWECDVEIGFDMQNRLGASFDIKLGHEGVPPIWPSVSFTKRGTQRRKTLGIRGVDFSSRLGWGAALPAWLAPDLNAAVSFG